ncbi:MAG: hypothetical protein ACOYM7_07135 [Paludibacter sp.]
MVKLYLRKSENSIVVTLLLMLLFFSACVSNDPVSYTSIKGAWKCRETSQLAPRTYLIDIYKSKSGETNYLFSNFHNIGVSGEYDINFTVIDNKLTFPPTENSNIRIKSGSGTVSADFKLILLDYVIYNGVNDIQYHAEYTR